MAIKIIHNGTANELWFINQETSGNNRVIGPGQSIDVGGAWVPWCWAEDQFLRHHLQIFDTVQDQVLWYIWQRRAGDGDFIRASSAGFEDPGAPIGGDAGTGGNRSITVNADGSLVSYVA